MVSVNRLMQKTVQGLRAVTGGNFLRGAGVRRSCPPQPRVAKAGRRAFRSLLMEVCEERALMTTWTDPMAIPGWFGHSTAEAAAAIADIDHNGRPDLIVGHVDDPAGENHGYYRIGFNLDTSGSVSRWSDPIIIPGWFGAGTAGMGIAAHDIDRNGATELLVLHVDDPARDNHGYWRLGWNLAADGRPTANTSGHSWTGPAQIPGWFGHSTQGAGIAVADAYDARGVYSHPNLYAFHIDNPSGENSGNYRVSTELTRPGHGGGSWTAPSRLSTGWWGHETQGADFAVADVTGDGNPDRIAAWIDNPSGDNHGYVRVDAGDAIQVPGWFGHQSSGAGVALSDIDGNGQLDLVFVHVDNPTGDNRGYLRVGFNFAVPSPPPAIFVDDISLAEGDASGATAEFTVRLVTPSTVPVTVQYATHSGTATAGFDYESASGTLTFAPGETERAVRVAVLGDRIPEPDEQFYVDLDHATNGRVLEGRATAVIRNDDAPFPTIAITDGSVTEGDVGRATAIFTVSLSAASTQTVAVHYIILFGSATSPSDFDGDGGTVIFLPGETEFQITVNVIGDGIPEDDETFFVGLRAPVNATLVREEATGTILDDDRVPRAGAVAAASASAWAIATPISLAPGSGRGEAQGAIDHVLDADTYQFVAPASGQVTIRLDTPRSSLDPYLFVYDGTGSHALLASNDDFNGLDSQVTIPVTAGQTYFIVADNYRDRSAGDYILRIESAGTPPADDNPNGSEWSRATIIQFDARTAAAIDGTIEIRTDTDLFAFVARSSGDVRIRLDTPRTTLDPYLFVYDGTSGHALLASNDDFNGLDSQVTIPVTAGQTYFIVADNYRDRSAGDYVLRIESAGTLPADDNPNGGDWSRVTVIHVDTGGAAAIDGAIETRTDTDLFAFVAHSSGDVRIRLDTPASNLDPYLYVFDGSASHSMLASNDDANGLDSELALRVTAGQTYFVLADNYANGSTGTYSIRIQPATLDDQANGGDWERATPITVDAASGVGERQGVLESRTDTDLYSFVATSTGQVTIRLDTPTSNLDSYLYVYDGEPTHTQLAANDDRNGTDSEVTLNVTSGQRYYLLADNYANGSSGTYWIRILERPLQTMPAAHGGNATGLQPSVVDAVFGEI